MLDSTPPPDGFSTGALYSAPLTIYFLSGPQRPPDMEHRVFWVRDHKGMLGSCTTIDELLHLIVAQAKRKPDESRKHFWPKARDLFFPGDAEAWEKHMIEVDNAVPSGTIAAMYAKAKPERSKPGPSLSLEDLGL